MTNNSSNSLLIMVGWPDLVFVVVADVKKKAYGLVVLLTIFFINNLFLNSW